MYPGQTDHSTTGRSHWQEAIGGMNAQDMDAAVRELEAISDEEAKLLLRNEANEFGNE